MARGLTRRQIGVTEEMIESYGDVIFGLSHNHQVRRGDPIRLLDFKEIERQRADMGLTDAQIAELIGLTRDQVLFIRTVLERQRFKQQHYQRLLGLGGGRRFRAERFTPHEKRPGFRSAALELRASLRFDPARVRDYVQAGWWRDDTLTGWLRQRARERPDHPAIRTAAGAIGYAELERRAVALGSGLARIGIGKGDVVAVQLPNVPEFLVTYLAIAGLGAVMTTLHMPYRSAEFKGLLSHSGARAAVCLGRVKEDSPAGIAVGLKDELPALVHILALGEDVEGALSVADLAAREAPAEDREPPVASDLFLLLYTSGTMSAPKGVPLNYHTMLSNARLGVPEHGLGADDIVLSLAPFTHLFGLYSIHLSLCAGATMALLPAFSPAELAAAIENMRPTALFAAPAHIAACASAGVLESCDLSSLKLAILSGSACPPDLMRSFDARMPQGRVVQLWGMTETQAGLYTRPHDPIDVAASSAGRPSPGTEVRIVGEDGTVLEPGQEGELQIRGCLLFPGYFKNEEANRDAFAADGWFRSGDLARADKAGNIAITGRIKDLINRGGMKYNPREIEELLDQYPKILQSAIVGAPDETLGERAVCFAVPSEAARPSLEDLCLYLEKCGVAKTKFPERLELVDEMPMTPTRKIIKPRLLERLA